MIQVVPQMKVLLCVDPADFRKGIDGLCAICWKWQVVFQTYSENNFPYLFSKKMISSPFV